MRTTQDNLPEPEKTKLTIGIVPLSDCAPIVIAREKGFFKKYGLDVQLSKEVSWANIRDKLAIGALDAAQMLATMPVASSLGIEAVRKPTVTAFTLGLNGNAVTVSSALYDKMVEVDPEAMKKRPLDAGVLKKVIDSNAFDRPLTFAMVFPVSTHNYQIRYWLAAAGIEPDKDVHLTVIPPVHMFSNLEAGLIDGYCVGEPWNSLAVARGIGHTLVTGYEIWNNSPEKVLGVNREWAEAHPNTHLCMVMALLEAGEWLDDADNRIELSSILSSREYLDVPEEILKMSLTGSFTYDPGGEPRHCPDFNVFHRYAANFPWPSHGQWFLTQMIRWGQVNAAINTVDVTTNIYMTDLYRKACDLLGVASPVIDSKQEGIHSNNWCLDEQGEAINMGSDCFIDGKIFDPDNLIDYLQDTSVHHMAMPVEKFFE